MVHVVVTISLIAAGRNRDIPCNVVHFAPSSAAVHLERDLSLLIREESHLASCWTCCRFFDKLATEWNSSGVSGKVDPVDDQAVHRPLPLRCRQLYAHVGQMEVLSDGFKLDDFYKSSRQQHANEGELAKMENSASFVSVTMTAGPASLGDHVTREKKKKMERRIVRPKGQNFTESSLCINFLNTSYPSLVVEHFPPASLNR